MRGKLVILGPTSTGKTDLALQLANKFQGEIISADSRQVYKDMDIGTGKMPAEEVVVKKEKGFWEMNRIKVWMYDVADPRKQYIVFDYVKAAEKIIDNILEKGKLPIIVGGSGLYIKALLEGLSNLTIPRDLKLRKGLESLSLSELQKRLQEISPQTWNRMNNSDKQNPRRLIRAIEIAKSNNKSFVDKNATTVGLLSTLDILKIGLTAPREILYQRIDQRVIDRLNQGMIEEAKSLYKRGLSFKRMRQLGLEYGILADYLEGKITNYDQLIKTLQGKIHGYARRQLTWFKKEKNIYWFDITGKNLLEKVENLVTKWYDKPSAYAEDI